ncbi:ATP-binding protein [Polymorphospora lycopeni]|uniref:ATP-binding protein n=1 Tax=Polymorphospora lycopeni TaxID=3140240 RepID=A0ABV5CU50_9ACTN
MPTDVRCLVKSDDPSGLVELVGVLDLSAAGSLRGALLRCLADRGDTVVVDVSGLRVDEPAALTVFRAVAAEAEQWPAGRFVLYVPPGMPDTSWGEAGVPVARDLPEAFTRLAAPGPVTTLRDDLEPVVGAARRVRDLVTEGCGRWDLPEVAGSACIAATEMVNNVVAHAHTPMTIRLAARDGALHLSVRDWSTVLPRFGGPVAPSSTGGRGLLLIDTVARRWGTTALDDGKVVWAMLHPDDEPT